MPPYSTSLVNADSKNLVQQFLKRSSDANTASNHDEALNNTKATKWGERTFSFGLYNAYSRQNPFYLYFGYNEEGERKLKQLALFPVLPFVAWTFKFDKKRS